jgi:hypothetical protein
MFLECWLKNSYNFAKLIIVARVKNRVYPGGDLIMNFRVPLSLHPGYYGLLKDNVMHAIKCRLQLEKIKLKKRKRLSQYIGCLKLTVDPLRFQRQIRDEWQIK